MVEIEKGIDYQDGGSARDLFTGSGFINRKYITRPSNSIVNFRHFHSFLAPYSQLPAPYFYFKMLLPRFRVTVGPVRSILKYICDVGSWK